MTKIKKILDEWPLHTVAVDSWLTQQGVYSRLKQSYIKSGWVASIGRGAIIRAGDIISWKGALHTLQNYLHLPLHVGGKTALEFQGYGHFVKFQETIIYLYTNSRLNLPRWFKNINFKQEIVIIRNSFLPDKVGLIEEKIDNISLILSSPERAFLEMLLLVPRQQSFQEAYLIAQGLARGRPKLMQELLEQCKSVQSKRLAFFFGDFLQHEWFKRLNQDRIDLGKGGRVIIKSGQYNKKYCITIPKDFEKNANY